MPLRADIKLLRETGRWPEQLVAAVEAMKAEAGRKAVTPYKARALIARHVTPVCPALELGDQPPSWVAFEALGRLLAAEGAEFVERCVGDMLVQFPVWCGAHRKYRRTPSTYCALCWRHTVGDQKYCLGHAPGSSPAAYRSALRRKADFLRALDYVASKERWSGAREGWDAMCRGDLPLGDWLRSDRPLVANALERDGFALNRLTPSNVLAALDLVAEESQGAARVREDLHKRLADYPDELFGMLRRAEAWFMARQHRKHGGSRPGSGRRSRA